MPLWRKLNILGWDLQVGWWLQYISVTRLISWYNISHVLKVYFILLQRFRLVIMSDHSSEPILVSHCPMTNFLFAVVWCSAVFVGNIESSYFGSYRSPNDPVSRSWHECWYIFSQSLPDDQLFICGCLVFSCVRWQYRIVVFRIV